MDSIRFKSKPISISEENPFADDLLGRAESAVVLTDLVKNLNEPFVLSIDSPWGTGKTTFLRMWLQYLKNQGVPCLYFNAWENDFSDEPIVSLMGELGLLIESLKLPQGEQTLAKKLFVKAKQTGIEIVKAAIPVALKIATHGVLDISDKSEDTISDAIGDLAKERIESYAADKKSIVQFKSNLRELIELLGKKSGTGQTLPLVFIIDELDRCRPTYAVELLEKIKHLFTVNGLVFVLSVDRLQLGESIKALYGAIDDDGYLRRFIDLEYRLPEPDSEKFSAALFERFSLDANLDAKIGDTRHDCGYIRRFVPEMFKLFGFTLRIQEQCFTQLAIVLKTTPANNYLYGVLLVVLICLRAKNRDLYVWYCKDQVTPEVVLNFIKSLRGGEAFIQSDSGCIVEAYLVKGIQNEEQKEALYESYSAAIKDKGPTSRRARRILEIIPHIGQNSRSMAQYIFKRIEISHRFVQGGSDPQS